MDGKKKGTSHVAHQMSLFLKKAHEMSIEQQLLMIVVVWIAGGIFGKFSERS